MTFRVTQIGICPKGCHMPTYSEEVKACDMHGLPFKPVRGSASDNDMINRYLRDPEVDAQEAYSAVRQTLYKAYR